MITLACIIYLFKMYLLLFICLYVQILATVQSVAQFGECDQTLSVEHCMHQCPFDSTTTTTIKMNREWGNTVNTQTIHDQDTKLTWTMRMQVDVVVGFGTMQGSDSYHPSSDYHLPLNAHPPKSGVDCVPHNPFRSDYMQQYFNHLPIHPSGSGGTQPPLDFYHPPINYTMSHTDHLFRSVNMEYYSGSGYSSVLFTVPHMSTSNPQVNSFNPNSNMIVPTQPATSMYSNVFPSNTKQVIMHEHPFFNHGTPSSEPSIPYMDSHILQAEGLCHHRETMHHDVICSALQMQKAVCKSLHVGYPPGIQCIEMLETPMSSVVTQNMPSVVRQTIPHYVLAAFQEKAGDHLHQYALLNKPMWCSDDSQYIGELLNKLTHKFFVGYKHCCGMFTTLHKC